MLCWGGDTCKSSHANTGWDTRKRTPLMNPLVATNRSDLVGAWVAQIIFFLSIAVFICRLAGQPRAVYWLGAVLLLTAIPLAYLLIAAPMSGRPQLYYVLPALVGGSVLGDGGAGVRATIIDGDVKCSRSTGVGGRTAQLAHAAAAATPLGRLVQGPQVAAVPGATNARKLARWSLQGGARPCCWGAGDSHNAWREEAACGNEILQLSTALF